MTILAPLRALKRHFPLLVVAGAALWSLTVVGLRRRAEAPPGAVVLRIGHWQLESGVRQGLEDMAAAYRELHPNVHIVQDAIPEMIYGQWMTTQLMGGTAPDLMQIGNGPPYYLLVQYLNRYFVPLTPWVGQPNPYNVGTPLEGEPLRATFKDGMRNSYFEEMQEYMTIPLSQYGIRVFYNRDLLKSLTGSDTAPADYRSFLAACEAIGAQADARGQPYVPIAGSRYHLPMWEAGLIDPITFPIHRVADFDRDGFVSNAELYVAFSTGRLDFSHPAIRGRFRMLRELTDHFQTGYTGLTRDEAVFLFAQQRAVFISTGTWDARSLESQAEGEFRVGVMDFPIPLPDDPVYGELIEGPIYERPGGGFPFGITRTCRHPEVALDFLLFMAGRDRNEELNRIIGWIPAVTHTAMDPMLEAFEPNLKGVYGCLNFFLGGESWLRWTQLYSLFQVNQISYDELAARFTPFYKERGLHDFLELQKDWRRGMHNEEQFLVGLRARAIMADDAEAAETFWIKYRLLTTLRQLWPEIEHQRQIRLVSGERALPELGPYEHSPAVAARVRDDLRRRRAETDHAVGFHRGEEVACPTL